MAIQRTESDRRFAAHRDGPGKRLLTYVQSYRNRPKSRNRLALGDSFPIRGCRAVNGSVTVDRDRHQFKTVGVRIDRRPCSLGFADSSRVSAGALRLDDFGKELTDQAQRNDELARRQATGDVGPNC